MHNTSATHASLASQSSPAGHSIQFDPQVAAIGIHAEQLIRMKAQGKSAADMLAWLRQQGLNNFHAGNLAEFWKRQEANLKTLDAHLDPKPAPKPGANPASHPRWSEIPSSSKINCGRASAPASGANGQCVITPASNRPDVITPGMDNFTTLMSQLIQFQFDALKKTPGSPDPQILKQITEMMKTVIKQEKNRAELALRERELKLKEAGHELKVKKLALEQARFEARQKTAQEREVEHEAAQNFDNTEYIAAIRKEYFKDAFNPEMEALVAAKLAVAEAGGIG